MNPSDIGRAYDQITHLWGDDVFDKQNGIEQHKRAIELAKNRGKALDVGCGCTGRFIDLLLTAGYVPEGVDVSQKVIELARQKHPKIPFHHVDICQWSPPGKYDFITAWDSIWHIPLNEQTHVISKLVSCLNDKGILIFSFGGTDEQGEHTDDAMGPLVYYSTLGTNQFMQLLIEQGCMTMHLEYDHYPEVHKYCIAQKGATP
jgi:trans-aconitate methyltransferase